MEVPPPGEAAGVGKDSRGRKAAGSGQSQRKSAPGELWAVGAVLGYTASNLTGRAGVITGNPLAAPLLRDVPSLLMGLFLLVRGRHWPQLDPRSPRFAGRALLYFVAAGLASVLGTFAFYFSLQLGGVNVAIPVLQTQLIWGSLIGVVMLGERLSPRGILAMFVAFGGLVLLAVGQSRGVPVSDQWLLGALLALVPAVGWGFSGVIWRYGQSLGVDQSTGITVQFGVSVIAAFAFLLFSGNLRVYGEITVGDFSALLASGVFAGMIAVYCMFNAMRLLPAARVFVMNALTPLLTALFAGVLLGEYINGVMWVGMGIASFGVVLFQLTGVRRSMGETSR